MSQPKPGDPPVSIGRRLKHLIEAGLLIGLLQLSRLFSLERASAIGGWIGRKVAAPLLRKSSTVRTIRIAFPDLDQAGAVRLIDGMADNLGRTLAETAHLEKFMGEAGKSRFSFEGLEHIEAARDSGRPILIVSGHFGNFELAFVVLHHVGVRCAAITRRPNNAYVADWFANKRAHLGFDQQIPKGPEGTRRMVSMLRHGGHVGMLADQRLSEGIPVPLFGHDAMTVHTPATLALSHGVIVLPIAVRREPDARFRAVFHPPIEPPGLGSEARDIIAMTTALNAFVETEVRARPTDWLWMHKRWEPAETLSRRAAKLLEAARDTAVREN